MPSLSPIDFDRRNFLKIACMSALGPALGPLSASAAAEADEPLRALFLNPPAWTRPRCYWYWLDGHVSREGITRDLEAMKRIGIGGAYIGIIGGGYSGIPNGEVKVLTGEFWEMMRHASREADRLGVELGTFNSPGWSQSGGPWVKTEQSMRYLSSVEVRLQGPLEHAAKLPSPKGEFQDIRVIAFPAPSGDSDTLDKHAPRISGDTKTGLIYELEMSFTARSLKITPANALRVDVDLMVSDDGASYRPVRKVNVDRTNLKQGAGPLPLAPVNVVFPAVASRYFKLSFSAECELPHIEISAAARVEHGAEKQLAKVCQGYNPEWDFYMWPPQAEPDDDKLMVAPDSVLDLTEKLGADGALNWSVPAGEWIVQRWVAMPTRAVNTPAPPEATGPEVDKMSREALRVHFDAYIGEFLRRVPPDERKTFKYVIADSWETGPQNWTDDFIADFKKRYGYDPVPFFPALSGRLVAGADRSNRFLWDVRRMVADRIAEDYVGGMRDLCREHGLEMWLENYGHWGFCSEFLTYGGQSDNLGGEFWVGWDRKRTLELRGPSSAAHTYGKKTVWAEAFTGGPPYQSTPRDLKSLGDWSFCHGVNQYVLHLVIHQPWKDRLPGVNAWFGTEFNAHNTWFEKAKPWVDYLRRCSVMLHCGDPVADVAYFIGDDSPKMIGTTQPALPPGYDFDYLNSDVIINRMKVVNGRFVLPGGASYALLVLPPQDTMRPEVLSAICKLVAAGGAILGPPPDRSPSNKNHPQCDKEVRRMAGDLWQGQSYGKGLVCASGDLNGVLKGISILPDVICEKGILWKHRRDAETDIYFVSNQANIGCQTDVSFRVTNRTPELWWPDSGRVEAAPFTIERDRVRVSLPLGPAGSVFVVFREKPQVGRILNPPVSLGKLVIRKAVYGTGKPSESLDVTKLLDSAIHDGQLVFLCSYVTFKGDPAYGKSKQLHIEYEMNGKSASLVAAENQWVSLSDGEEITGPWEVTFDQTKGGPVGPVLFETLEDWTKRPENGIRYYSGTAVYRKSFKYRPTDRAVILNLGIVHSIATVRLNGRELETVWAPPYSIDVSQALKPGNNRLEIEVVSSWFNRLVGDEQPGLEKRISFVTYKGSIKANSLLHPSGLLGPITLK